MPSLAEEYVAAVKANNHNKANDVYKKLLAAGEKVSKKKVMAAYNAIKGPKEFLRRAIINPGYHSSIFGMETKAKKKTKKGGKTRRGRGTRRTRRA